MEGECTETLREALETKAESICQKWRLSLSEETLLPDVWPRYGGAPAIYFLWIAGSRLLDGASFSVEKRANIHSFIPGRVLMAGERNESMQFWLSDTAGLQGSSTEAWVTCGQLYQLKDAPQHGWWLRISCTTAARCTTNSDARRAFFHNNCHYLYNLGKGPQKQIEPCKFHVLQGLISLFPPSGMECFALEFYTTQVHHVAPT